MTTPATQVEAQATATLDLPVSLITTFDDADPGEQPAVNGFRLMEILMLPLRNEPEAIATHHALVVANVVRKALGLPPAEVLKPGYRGNSEHCVIAETILDGYDGSKGTVHVGCNSTEVGGKSYAHPKEARDFISRFDTGGLSDLALQ